MQLKHWYGFIFLIVVLSVILFFPKVEPFSNYTFANWGNYPTSEVEPLLAGSAYPLTGQKTVGNANYNTFWWQRPIFSEPSYAQITNNIRYNRNIDDGSTIPADMTNVLYGKIQNKSNYVFPLPPANLISENSVRVNYQITPNNLFLGPQIGPSLSTLI